MDASARFDPTICWQLDAGPWRERWEELRWAMWLQQLPWSASASADRAARERGWRVRRFDRQASCACVMRPVVHGLSSVKVSRRFASRRLQLQGQARVAKPDRNYQHNGS